MLSPAIASNGDQKEDKALLQHSQFPQHGEYWHASVSERQRSRVCGQNLRVPFLRTVLPPEVEESARAMAATARQKRSYLHHQGEFQHNYFDFVSLHDSDHDGSAYDNSRSTDIFRSISLYVRSITHLSCTFVRTNSARSFTRLVLSACADVAKFRVPEKLLILIGCQSYL